MAISGNVELKAPNLLEHHPSLIVRLMDGATPTTYFNTSNTTAAPTTTSKVAYKDCGKEVGPDHSPAPALALVLTSILTVHCL